MADPGLNEYLPTSQIMAGTGRAHAMNELIVLAIRSTGLANDGTINAADVRDLSAWLRANHADTWVTLHGDDEDDEETGFHLVQNDGATTRLFDENAVDTVADGIYHLGFEIQWGQLLNEDGNANACVEMVAGLADQPAADRPGRRHARQSGGESVRRRHHRHGPGRPGRRSSPPTRG